MNERSTIDSYVRDALLGNAAGGPPIPFTSADVIRAGRRSRALHRGAIATGASWPRRRWPQRP